MHTRQYDDDLVSGVGSAIDQASVVGGFAGLHVATNQTTPIPRAFPARVFQVFTKDRPGASIEVI